MTGGGPYSLWFAAQRKTDIHRVQNILVSFFHYIFIRFAVLYVVISRIDSQLLPKMARLPRAACMQCGHLFVRGAFAATPAHDKSMFRGSCVRLSPKKIAVACFSQKIKKVRVTGGTWFRPRTGRNLLDPLWCCDRFNWTSELWRLVLLRRRWRFWIWKCSRVVFKFENKGNFWSLTH